MVDQLGGGVNLRRAVRVLRDLVAVTAGLPVEVLDRLVLVGQPLGTGAAPLPVMWSVVDRVPDVGWVELIDEAHDELIDRLARRAERGLERWDGTGDEVGAVMTVVACEAAAQAFRALVPTDLCTLLHIPWQIATGDRDPMTSATSSAPS